MDSRNVLIVGTGNFAEIAALYFEEVNSRTVIGYTAEDEYVNGQEFAGRRLYPLSEVLQTFDRTNLEVYVAIGYRHRNKIRQRILDQLTIANFSFASFIHPSVHMWMNTKIDEHLFIFEDNTVQPFCEIGRNVVLWSGNHIGHHSVIEDNVFISSHVVVSGSCTIGANTFIGVNASLHDGVKVGKSVVIGAGVVVREDVPDGAVMLPAPSSVKN